MGQQGMSPERLIQFKLQQACSSDELLELSPEQMIDVSERPPIYARDPERIVLIKWLYKDDWEQHMDNRFRINLP